MSKSIKENSRIVFSTVTGRMCPDCEQPVDACECHLKTQKISGDGIARVRRETKGRGGKTVTTISGLPLNQAELDTFVTELKRHCGAGGSVKESQVIIQGDHCTSIMNFLEKKGIKAKRAGG